MNLSGMSVLVTAGPTIEMWDSVRFLSNLSSGKMGFSLAKKAKESGADVILISTIEEHKTDGMKFINVKSALEMFEAVKKEFSGCDIFISAAAVCDFMPVRVQGKIEKRKEIPEMRLERNPDILKWAGENSKEKTLVGFSLTDKTDIDEGLRKKQEKNCDIMVLNTVGNIAKDRRSFVILSGSEATEYSGLGLDEAARVILENASP
jgi:phosphopantothenoylcysteine decarboxylase/phosphopantothenate--cysteine ligase